MEKEEIIAELRRVATGLKTDRMSQRQFKELARVSMTTIRYTFGSWSRALEAAGLRAYSAGPAPELHQQKIADEDLLGEILRLTKDLGKKPTENEMNALGAYSVKPYRKRWGSFNNACKVAYAKQGTAALQSNGDAKREIPRPPSPSPPLEKLVVPQTHKPKDTNRRKKVQFGEPIDFRGLRFAPINEQGVVYVFGMISRELGFLIESIQTDYPDCEGKRCVDPKKRRWEHVLIEFEYQSINFREHGHSPEDCNLIVCWIHDWDDCPIEVLELRSQIKYLPNR
jgi:hypothetical protein